MQDEKDIAIISQELCYFISTNILAEGVLIKNDTILSHLGVDSFSVIEIILFIERRFGVVIPDESLLPENLHCVDALARCTYRHQKNN